MTAAERKAADVLEKKKTKYKIQSYFITQKTIHIASGSEATLVVNFMPFYLGKHGCSIVLCDERVGEMEWRVKGTGLMPEGRTLP